MNDGDDVVAAVNHAQSTGMTDSELFLDSSDPSLYDALSEAYGEPVRRTKMENAIAIGIQKVRENENRPAENQKAGREFSTVRGRRPAPRPMDDLQSQAMFYVEGRVPLHLRLAAYDDFDGVTWQAANSDDAPDRLAATGEGTWMRLIGPTSAALCRHERHSIKIARFATDSIPTPPHLARFKIGDVNRVDFFHWSSSAVLRTIRKSLPAGTIVEMEDRVLNTEELGMTDFLRSHASPASERASVGNALRGVPLPAEQQASGSPALTASLTPPDGAAERGALDELRGVAESWTRGIPPGWPQIAALAERLKQDYVLDGDYQLPPDCTDAVGHFLFRSRRGPDYQFASAAAALLRTLGYDTRLVSGFCARPERFDWGTGNTPVTADDVHVWCEVRLLTGLWTPLEAAPGYELLGPPLSWGQRLKAAFSQVAAWGGRHFVWLVAAMAVLAGGFAWRGELADLTSTLVWRWTFGRRWDARVLATLRLLERRLSRACLPRPTGKTPRRWYGQLVGVVSPELADDVTRFARLADCAVYAPRRERLHSPWSEEEVARTCLRLANGWTFRRLRKVARPVGDKGTRR